VPAAANAQSLAYSVEGGYTNLREGPGPYYRVLALIYPGTQLEVIECLASNDWCDVVAQDIRGWVSTSRMVFEYARQEPIVPYYDPFYDDQPTFRFRFGDGGRHHDGDRRRHHDWQGNDGGHHGRKGEGRRPGKRLPEDDNIVVEPGPGVGAGQRPDGDFVDTRPPGERRVNPVPCTQDLACPQ